MSYTQLFFNAVEINATSNSVSVAPNFLCPKCESKPQAKVVNQVAFLPSKDLDLNGLVTFTMPCCGAKISLYVALHKTKGVDDLAVCIQRSDAEGAVGIPENWWVRFR